MWLKDDDGYGKCKSDTLIATLTNNRAENKNGHNWEFI